MHASVLISVQAITLRYEQTTKDLQTFQENTQYEKDENNRGSRRNQADKEKTQNQSHPRRKEKEQRNYNLEPVIEGEIKSAKEKQIAYINANAQNLEKWY